MKRRLRTSAAAAAPALLLAAALSSGAQNGYSSQTAFVLGQPLPGLTGEQSRAFKEGLQAFSAVETRDDGLGPVFNGTACAECHKAGAIGGAGVDLTISRVTRIGGWKGGVYTDLPEFGGPVLQARSLKEFDTACPINGETVPPEANAVSRRITTPLFGAGLIEAIPDAAILARVGQRDPDGVAGVPNLIPVAGSRRAEVGRFGWKAQHSRLDVFAADAYLNEMGITTALFPAENLPQGKPIPAGWDTIADPEDHDNDTEAFATFMRFLAPPTQRVPVTARIRAGERLFEQARCTACHTPEFQTGPNPIPALANQRVRLFSDLLLHRMPALADGIQQGDARGDQFRTAPLWGLSRRNFYLHDGRARTIPEAIAWHDGEAAAARQRYNNLSPENRELVLAFLNSL